jgi:hypothetical protein
MLSQGRLGKMEVWNVHLLYLSDCGLNTFQGLKILDSFKIVMSGFAFLNSRRRISLVVYLKY